MNNPIPYVLVTGATGFIGAHVVDELLRRGIKVKGTTRSLSKAQKMCQDRPEHADMLDFDVITDLAHPGVFDEAAQGVDAIIHVASPVTYNITDNERELLLPAIQGTKAILTAAKKHPTVKRIVITSSFAAVLDPAHLDDSNFTFTSKDWSPFTYEQAKSSDPVIGYRGAKKFAERAAWDCIQNETPHFDLVTICPPMVFGPVVHPVSKVSELNESTKTIWEVVSGADPLPVGRVTAWVDVRDVAFAHVEALLRPEAGNQRFLIASPEKFSYQLAADILRKEFSWAREVVTRGDEGAPMPEKANVDGEAVAKALGIQYRGFKDCVIETATQLRELHRREISS